MITILVLFVVIVVLSITRGTVIYRRLRKDFPLAKIKEWIQHLKHRDPTQSPDHLKQTVDEIHEWFHGQTRAQRIHRLELLFGGIVALILAIDELHEVYKARGWVAALRHWFSRRNLANPQQGLPDQPTVQPAPAAPPTPGPSFHEIFTPPVQEPGTVPETRAERHQDRRNWRDIIRLRADIVVICASLVLMTWRNPQIWDNLLRGLLNFGIKLIQNITVGQIVAVGVVAIVIVWMIFRKLHHDKVIVALIAAGKLPNIQRPSWFMRWLLRKKRVAVPNPDTTPPSVPSSGNGLVWAVVIIIAAALFAAIITNHTHADTGATIVKHSQYDHHAIIPTVGYHTIQVPVGEYLCISEDNPSDRNTILFWPAGSPKDKPGVKGNLPGAGSYDVQAPDHPTPASWTFQDHPCKGF